MPDQQPHSLLLTLCDDFPRGTPKPKFALGDRVRFIPTPAEDYGVVSGFQYAPAEHLQDWAWRYTVWLDLQSPSHAWTCADLAWEDDLALLLTVSLVNEEQPA